METVYGKVEFVRREDGDVEAWFVIDSDGERFHLGKLVMDALATEDGRFMGFENGYFLDYATAGSEMVSRSNMRRARDASVWGWRPRAVYQHTGYQLPDGRWIAEDERWQTEMVEEFFGRHVAEVGR